MMTQAVLTLMGKRESLSSVRKTSFHFSAPAKTPNCNKPLISKPSITVTGFAVVVTTECVDGHSFMWHSQPKIGNIYESNLLIPSVLFLTGHSFTVYNLVNLMNLCALSPRQCYNIQRAYILPEIEDMPFRGHHVSSGRTERGRIRRCKI